MEEGGRWGDRMVYFLFGGLVGAVTALLLAPKTGEETRELLTTKMKESREVIGGGLKTAQEQIIKTKELIRDEAKDLLDKGKSVVSKEKEVISAAIEAGKQAYKEEKDSSAKPAPAKGKKQEAGK